MSDSEFFQTLEKNNQRDREWYFEAGLLRACVLLEEYQEQHPECDPMFFEKMYKIIMAGSKLQKKSRIDIESEF